MFHSIVSVAALLVAQSVAQTYTECQPLNSTCPADLALGTTYSDTFNSSATELNPAFYNITAGESLISFADDGMEMRIVSSGDSVTAQTSFYIFWGQVEILMKAASGAGIISTMILISDDLDEVDWEIIGNNHTHVSTNWYGHGNTSQYNAVYYPVDGPQDTVHNYTINWQQDQVQWILDNKVVRTVPYAASGQYPQTPSIVRFGIWAAGDAKFNPPGTVTWAGGETDYSQGPFVASVQSIKITDGSTNTSSYAYGDKTGSWDSIKVVDGESAAYKSLHQQSTVEQAEEHWNGLSTGAKIGIACGVLGVFGIALIAFAFYCVKQRRAGKQERIAADREWEAQQAEMMTYRQQMSKGGFAMSNIPVNNNQSFRGDGRKF